MQIDGTRYGGSNVRLWQRALLKAHRKVGAQPSRLGCKSALVDEEMKSEMSFDVNGFIRPHLKQLSPYKPIEPFEVRSVKTEDQLLLECQRLVTVVVGPSRHDRMNRIV